MAKKLVLPAIFVYFLYFAIPALKANFATDDPMNIRYYWARGIGRSLLDTVDFWHGGYRPMGAVFYMPIYRFAVLNPIPYRIAALTILAASLYFTFRAVEEISRSTAAAALAAIIVASHRLMVGIYYNTSMIYDLLAYFFTVAMLCAYVRLRRRGPLTIPSAAWIVVLYLAAIDSKEMAAVGAVWISAWELICMRPRRFLVPAILVAITAIYAAARLWGPHALAGEAGYKLEITSYRFFSNNLLYLNDIFRAEFFNRHWKLIALWIALAAIGALVRRREFWWCALAAICSTLPTSFTAMPRGDSGVCLPLFAWLLAGSIIFVAMLPRAETQWRLAAALAILWTWAALPGWNDRPRAFLDDHRLTSAVIEQMRTLPAHPPPNSRILILNDPFEYWDMRLIADVFWNDHTLDIDLGKKMSEPPDPNSYNWVLAWEGETLRAVKIR